MEDRRCNISFPDNKEGQLALAFLNKGGGRLKGKFIAKLICLYLNEHGINSVSDIKKCSTGIIHEVMEDCIKNRPSTIVVENDNVEMLKALIQILSHDDEHAVINKTVINKEISEKTEKNAPVEEKHSSNNNVYIRNKHSSSNLEEGDISIDEEDLNIDDLDVNDINAALNLFS